MLAAKRCETECSHGPNLRLCIRGGYVVVPTIDRRYLRNGCQLQLKRGATQLQNKLTEIPRPELVRDSHD